MTSENPLSTWQANFKRDVQMLSQLMLLRTQRSDEDTRKKMRPLFQKASESLTELESAKALLESYVRAQRAQLARLEQFHDRVALQKRRVAEIRAAVPVELSESLACSGRTPTVSWAPSPDGVDTEAEKENFVENTLEEQPLKQKNKVTKKKTIGNTSKPRPMSSKPKLKANATKKVDVQMPDSDEPTVRPVEQHELDAAPQYVKGRLTVPKIAAVAKKLTEIARKKYALLAQPFRALNSSDMTAWQEMQEAECSETEGRHFLTDSEIKTFGGYRMDATVKAAINMLRHTGALKEVRGKNRVRILLIQ